MATKKRPEQPLGSYAACNTCHPVDNVAKAHIIFFHHKKVTKEFMYLAHVTIVHQKILSAVGVEHNTIA